MDQRGLRGPLVGRPRRRQFIAYTIVAHYNIFDQKPGYFRETPNDHVMEKVDDSGKILGFSVLRVSALKDKPLAVAL